MISNPVLEEKWRIQENMAREADYDVDKLADIVHQIVEKMVAERGVALKYSDRKPCIDKRPIIERQVLAKAPSGAHPRN